MNRALVFSFLSIPLFLGVAGSPAFAGCDPKCKDGAICRYEAAGGIFYCDPPGLKKGGKVIQGGREVRPGGGGALRPGSIEKY